MPEKDIQKIDIQKIDMLLKAFNIKPKSAEWDENTKKEELAKFISKQTTAAKKFFAANSAATKMKRKDPQDPNDPKDKVDCSIIKIINNDNNGNNDKQELYLMSGKGQSLGAGSSGRAKLAIRISPTLDFNLCVIKREWTNNQKQQQETATLKDLKILVGDKMQRVSTTTKRPSKHSANPNDNSKFYTVMPYLGEDLINVMKNNQLNEQQKLDLGIKIALEVYNLHTQKRYAHLDLKPDNITVDTSTRGVYKVHLIDFGFSKQIDASNKFTLAGTPTYFPGAKFGLGNMDPAFKSQLQIQYGEIGHIGLDVFALKRTLSQEGAAKEIALIDIENLKTVNRVLYEMLSTKDDLAALQRKDTVAMIAANLILHSLNLYPACTLSDENSKEIIALYETPKTAVNLKDQLEAMLKKLHSNIFAAAKIFEDNLSVKPGEFILDEDLAQKILSLQAQNTAQNTDPNPKPDMLKTKLQQLFFFTQVLGINIPIEKLSDTLITFPKNYPNISCLDQQNRDLCLAYINAKISTLGFDPNNMNTNTCIDMMRTLYIEGDKEKTDMKLLSIYLDIKIDDDVLKSPQKYQSILAVFKKLQGLNLNVQKDLIQKCLVLSKNGRISELDIGRDVVDATGKYMDLKKDINMLHALCTEVDEQKRTIKLLLIYFEIPIDEDALISPQKCQNILRILDYPNWETLDFLKQQELMEQYLVFSKIDIVSEFNFQDLATLENKELVCCQKYLQPPYTDGLNSRQLDELKIKVNKMLTIQMTFSLWFDRQNDIVVDAHGLYQMSEQQLDHIFQDCSQLILMMNHEIIDENSAIFTDPLTKNYVPTLLNNIYKYAFVYNAANNYDIPLFVGNITDANLETIYNLLVEVYQSQEENASPQTANNQQNKEKLLLLKVILVHLDLDSILDAVNISGTSHIMLESYKRCYGKATNLSMKQFIAFQIITNIVNNNPSKFQSFDKMQESNFFHEACIIICEYYQKQPQENRPDFNDVLIVGLNAFETFEKSVQKQDTLENCLTTALEAHKVVFTQSQFKTALQAVRESDQPQEESSATKLTPEL